MKKSMLVTLVLALLLPVALFAQGVTTGAFAGKVVDVDGKPVLAAEITIIHVPTGTRYVTLSRPDGNYSVPSVRVGGPYTITVSFQGFKTEKIEGITVKLGENKVVDIKMQLATVEEKVSVQATDAVINPYRTGASQNVVRDAIENLPSISRSLSDFVRLSPQMAGNEEADGAFSAGGRSSRYNNIQIDGAQNNDLFGLGSSGTPGDQAGTTPISMEAIQEFQIVLAPYDVRQGMFTGGGVNVITKSGSNQFHGSAYFEGRNENFVGKGPSNTDFSKFSESLYGISVGGPIVKDKLFFFLSGEISDKKTPGDYYSQSDTSSGFDFGHKTELDQIAAHLNDLGYDAGTYGQISNKKKNYKLFSRIDWNINDKHRLTVRNNYIDAKNDSLLRDNNRSFYFGNAGVIYKDKTNSSVLQLNSVFGQNLSNELILNYTTIRDNPTYMGEAFPSLSISLGGGITVYAGSEQYRHRNILNQDLIEITDTLTYFKGKHTFVLGTHNELFKFYNVYVQKAFGRYEFSSLPNFLANKPSRYDRYYSITGDPNAPAEFSVAQLGGFVGDEWAVLNNLTLTLGVRADVPIMNDKPLENPAVYNTFGYHTSDLSSGKVLWSPRIGFNYSPFEGKKTQIRGGIGIFSGRTPYVWISNQYSNTGMDLARYYLTSGVNFFITDPYNQPVSPTATYSGDINLLDKGYKFPQVLKTNFAIDQKLPFGFTGTLEFVYSKSINEIFVQNINIAPNGQHFDFLGGRDLFGTQSTSVRSPYGTPNYVNKSFKDVLLLKNTSLGYQYSLSFQLQREWADGSMINASYTNGMSKDVNSGTSSRAISNWQYNNTTGDPNKAVLSFSSFDVRHRILMALSKKFNFLRNAPTIFSVVYNGRSGRPFSLIYINDVNGDGVVNDLVYVPNSADEQIITNGTWEDMEKFINGDPNIKKYRGKIMPRNAARDPWYHEVDLKLIQRVPIPFLKGNRLEISLTINNFFNMLDKDWGVYKYINFDESPWGYVGMDQATGRPKIELRSNFTNESTRYQINQLLSRWKMLLGLSYKF